MRNIKRIGAVVALVTAGAGGVVMAKAKGKKDLSGLPAEVQAVHSMVGTWKGTGTIQVGSESADIKLSMACEATAGDFGVLCKTRISGLPGGAVQEETDLFGYDAGARKYHWFSVNSGGDTHDHVAELPADREAPTISFVYSGLQGGEAFQEIIDLTFTDDCTRMQFRNVASLDGAALWSMTGKATKK